jgi:hypothetical protein
MTAERRVYGSYPPARWQLIIVYFNDMGMGISNCR